MGHTGPYHTDGIIISTQTDSQSKPREGSPRKDVLGQSFQMENLHGNVQTSSDTLGVGATKKAPKPHKWSSIKKLRDEVGCCKPLLWLFGKSLLNKHSHLLFKCKTINHFMVYCHIPRVDGMARFSQILEENSVCLLFKESQLFKRVRKGKKIKTGERERGREAKKLPQRLGDGKLGIVPTGDGDKREASSCPGKGEAREGNEGCFHIFSGQLLRRVVN